MRDAADVAMLARTEAVVIGASAGGIEALSVLLPALPADLRTAVLIVVHLPRDRASLLPKIFSPRCALRVKEADDKEPLARGTVYFAPADYHLQVEGTFHSGWKNAPWVSLSSDDPVNWSRPSIDVLFTSAADVFGPSLLAIVLSGGNHDGAAGLDAVRHAGGITVVEDPESAIMPTMPREALRLGKADFVLDLQAMKLLLETLT